MNVHRTEGEDAAIVGPERTFHLIELIGRGAFGAVYLAEQQSPEGFRRRVALKILNDGVGQDRRRMQEDARLLGLLTHRHIVAVHDLVRVEDRWAIQMDYVPGSDLAQIMDALGTVGTPFPVPAALEAGAAIFDALDFAAKLGIVHRDLKPGNVRITPDGDLKVLDFAIARFAADSETVPGTEGYLSPERMMREGDTDAGDVYAATVTLVELLVGARLGRSPLIPDRHQAFVDEAIGRVRTRIEAHPMVVEKIALALGRGLHADPTERPTARQLCNELESLFRQVEGPTLTEFARWFVPRVDGLVVRIHEPSVLAEDIDSDTTTEAGEQTGDDPSLTRPGFRADNLNTVDDVIKTDTEAGFFLAETVVVKEPAVRRKSKLLPVLAVGGGMACSLAFGAVVLAGLAGYGEVAEEWLRERGIEPMGEVPTVTTTTAPSLASVAAPTEPVQTVAFPVAEEPAEVAAAPEVRAEVAAAPASVDPAVAPDVARVSELTVSAEEASRITVTCGGVSASGTTSVLVANFPAGMCTFQVVWFDDTFRMATQILEPQNLACAIADGALRCS